MRTVRFVDPAGTTRQGEWTDEGVTFSDRTYSIDAVDILPPTTPTKVVCVGGNYRNHLIEAGYNLPEDIPDRPKLFLKGPNTISGHGDTVPLPTPGVDRTDIPDTGEVTRGERRIDFEAELGVVIGRQCRNVSRENVDEVIRGYTCLNDISNRDDQAVESNWVRGKAFDNSAPLGPVIAPPEAVPDNPRIRLWQNDELRQDSKGDELIYSVEDVIVEVTKFITLEPGDVIAMGTTKGVGPLSPGDQIDIEIEGIGTLTHYVEDSSSN